MAAESAAVTVIGTWVRPASVVRRIACATFAWSTGWLNEMAIGPDGSRYRVPATADTPVTAGSSVENVHSNGAASSTPVASLAPAGTRPVKAVARGRGRSGTRRSARLPIQSRRPGTGGVIWKSTPSSPRVSFPTTRIGRFQRTSIVGGATTGPTGRAKVTWSSFAAATPRRRPGVGALARDRGQEDEEGDQEDEAQESKIHAPSRDPHRFTSSGD